MKCIFLLVIFFILNLALVAQNNNTEANQIKKQMATIRQSTNWGDPVAAKAANAKIQELAVKLTKALRQGKPQTLPPGSEGIKPEEAAKIQQENDNYSNKLWSQMMKIVQEGGNGKWDLAEPLRKEIVEEYKDDENPAIKNNEWLQQIPYLQINVSMPGIQAVIDQMPLFRGIKILIVTCEKAGTPVDLSEIMKKASAYPLEELYVMNFGSSVTRIPPEVSAFSQLKILSFVNNQLGSIPESVGKLTMLNDLQVDLNPISEALSGIKSLKMLKQLSLVKTNIPESEIAQIQKLFPHCEITAK